MENKTPEVGPDSPAGMRWFISCRYPNIVVTIRSAHDKTPTTPRIVGLYAPFRSMAKPNTLQGRGKRGTENYDGTDMNDSGKWGIFGPIMDPGPEPEDGYKDDPISVPKDKRLKAAKKKENRETIDRLRETDHYLKTRQINEVDIYTILAEVNWDPIPHSGNISGVVVRGRAAVGKDGVAVESPSVSGAPEEERAAPPSVKVPSLGKKAAAV